MMKKQNKKNFNALLSKNKKVDVEELARNLEMIQQIEAAGIRQGANYQLGSPYSRTVKPESDRDPNVVILKHTR